MSRQDAFRARADARDLRNTVADLVRKNKRQAAEIAKLRARIAQCEKCCTKAA